MNARALVGMLALGLVGCTPWHEALKPTFSTVNNVVLQYPSGLRVVLEQHPGAGRVAIAVSVAAGGSSDELGKEGTAHFLEHLVFRTRPTERLELNDELDFAGVASTDSSVPNAHTTALETIYEGVAPTSRLPQALPLMASLVVRPLLGLTDAVIEVERGVVINEYVNRNPHGRSLLDASLAAVALGDRAPGARAVGGTRASLDAITRADLETFARKHYAPDAVTVMLVGDFDPDQLDALVRRSFPAQWLDTGSKRTPRLSVLLDPSSPPAPPPQEVPHRVVEANIEKRALYFVWSLPGTASVHGPWMAKVEHGLGEPFAELMRKTDDVVRWDVFPVLDVGQTMLVLAIEPKEGASTEKLSTLVRTAPIELGLDGAVRHATFVRLSEQQDLLEHAVDRVSAITATGRTGARELWGEGREKALAIAAPLVTWARARELELVPRVATTQIVPPPPPQLGFTPRHVVIDRQQLKDVALPLPLPEARHFTLRNGLQVVLSRRTPVPIASVTLAFPGGTELARKPIVGTLSLVLNWMDGRRYGLADPPEVTVHSGYTLVRNEGFAWNVPVMLDGIGHNMPPAIDFHGGTIVEWLAALDADARRDQAKNAKQSVETKRRSIFQRLMSPESTLVPLQLANANDVPAGEYADFVKRVFKPNGAVLVVDGDIDLAGTEVVVRELFTDWSPRESAPPKLRVFGTGQSTSRAPSVVENVERSMTTVRVGCRLPPAKTVEQRGAALVLQHALAALLDDRLRSSRGLTYGVHVETTDLATEENVLLLDTLLDPRGGQQALGKLLDVLDDLDGAVWDEQAVELGRWRAAKLWSGAYGSSRNISRMLATEMIRGSSYDDARALPARLAQVALKDVDEAWSACNDTLLIDVDGNSREIKALLDARKKK